MSNMIKKTRGEQIFRVFNVLFMLLVAAVIILPFMHVFALSVSSKSAINSMKVTLLPVGFHFGAYVDFIGRSLFLTSFTNSVWLTVVYAVLGLLVNTMAAYGFSKYFFGKKLVMYLFVITMYFSGGMIPSYLLISNTLKLYNSYLAFFLPWLVNVFYMIVLRSQIEALPQSLTEAAQIDGANEWQTLQKIVIPSIKPTLAAITMFLALDMWNMWYNVMVYTNKQSMWNLQYLLRSVVFEKLLESQFGADALSATDAADLSPLNYQMAAIITIALPIICIYPFVQKYFVKGILTGSVKE